MLDSPGSGGISMASKVVGTDVGGGWLCSYPTMGMDICTTQSFENFCVWVDVLVCVEYILVGSVLVTRDSIWRTVEEEQAWSNVILAVGVDVDEVFKVRASGSKVETVDDSDNAVGVDNDVGPSKEASK